MEKTFELIPIYDRKSFYGKARVTESNDKATLYSYNTPVASITMNDKKFHRLWAGYSATTMRHVNSFLRHYDVEGGGKKWWYEQKVE